MSGGGPVGVGWHAGMTTAWLDAGLPLADTELFVGSSAGAIVGAHIALGRRPLDEIDRIVDVDPGSTYAATVGANLQRLLDVMASSAELPEVDRLKALGRLSLEADVVPEETFLERYERFAGAWPPNFKCTAIDCEDGSFHIWDASSNVDPRRAVASSCAVPGFFPPITIDGRRYFDGGLRSLTNADIASGHERVLVLTLLAPPDGATDPRAVRMRRIFDREADAIREGGGTSLLIAPENILATSLMDPSKTKESAEAGFEQGRKIADEIREFWE